MNELFDKNKFDSKRKRKIVTEISDEFNRSRELIKEATSHKKTDIYKAIELIKESILLIDEVVLSDYFKLSNYYHLANDPKSYEILRLLRNSFDKDEVGMYFMNITQVEEKLCTIVYKEKKYKDYIFHFSCWIRSIVIAYACQGRKEPCSGIIHSDDKLKYLAPSKVKKSISELGIKAETIQSMLDNYFQGIISKTDYMSELAWEVEYEDSFRKDFKLNESSGQRADRILREQKLFMEFYNSFLNEDLNVEFKNKINTIANNI